MSCRPDIIVLDEPTTALDVTTQIEVLALLRDLIREYGTAGLYITHDLAVVAQIAHRIMVLRHGKMVEVGDAKQILEAPRTPYATALVNERRSATHTPLIDPPAACRAAAQRHQRRGRLSPRHDGGAEHQRRRWRRARRWRWSANPAPANPRWRASSRACCRAAPAT